MRNSSPPYRPIESCARGDVEAHRALPYGMASLRMAVVSFTCLKWSGREHDRHRFFRTFRTGDFDSKLLQDPHFLFWPVRWSCVA